MTNPILLNPEITFKLSDPAHAQQLTDAVDRNRSYLQEFLSWVPQVTSVEDFENYLKGCVEDRYAGLEWSYDIFHKNHLIGRIGIHNIDKNNNNAMIGYWIDERYQGKGIITEGCKKIIDIGFNQLGLHRLEILVAIDNHKSAAIPIRLGFQKEGILRQKEKHGPKFLDLQIFSILRHE